METRALRLGCVLVGLLLLALALYPPSFAGPLTTTDHETLVSPPGTEAYRAELDAVDATGSPEDLRVVEYESLSPEAQRFVDRALDRPANPRDRSADRYDPDASLDGAHVYDPDVCRAYAVACPGLPHDAVPPELEYEPQWSHDDVAMFVVRDDQRYLVTTAGLVRSVGNDPLPSEPLLNAVLRIAVLVPLGGVLVVLGAGSWARLARAFLLGYAALVASLARSSGIDLLGSAWALPWLVPGLLTPPSSNDRLLGVGIALGSLLAAVAIVPGYLTAYGVSALASLQGFFVGWLVGWPSAVVVLAAGWALQRFDSDERADGSGTAS